MQLIMLVCHKAGRRKCTALKLVGCRSVRSGIFNHRAFPTRDEAFQFALGIGKTLLAVPGGHAVDISDITVSIIGPTGSRETWSLKELLANAYLFADEEKQQRP